MQASANRVLVAISLSRTTRTAVDIVDDAAPIALQEHQGVTILCRGALVEIEFELVTILAARTVIAVILFHEVGGAQRRKCGQENCACKLHLERLWKLRGEWLM